MSGLTYIINPSTTKPYLPTPPVYLPPLTSKFVGGLGGIIDYCENNAKMFQCPLDNGPVSAPGALATSTAAYTLGTPYYVTTGQILAKAPYLQPANAQQPAPYGPYPGLSYEWNVGLNSGSVTNTRPLKPPSFRNRGNDLMSTTRIVNDLDNFHLAGGSLGPNVLYADGHVP